MSLQSLNRQRVCELTSYLLIALALFSIFPLRLLPCFLAGFIVYETILALTPWVEKWVKGPLARWIIIFFLTLLVVVSLVLGITKVIGFLLNDFQILRRFTPRQASYLKTLNERYPL